MKYKHRHMRGGFLDSLKTSLSNLGSSISQGASNAWNKTKTATTQLYDSATNKPTTSTMLPVTGGKTKRRYKRGGSYTANTPTMNIASHAAPITGIKTAQPHNLVGGKTKKRKIVKRKHSKSRRH